MKLTPKRQALIAAVRAHAAENYDAGGWDVIVECYDDEQIAEVIGRARTLKGALAKFATIIDVMSDRRAAAESERHAAVGEVEHYRTGSQYSYEQPGCACGATFTTDKAADIHAAKARQANGTYSRFDAGYHPDGSHVRNHFSYDGEFLYATRAREGKVGHGHIAESFGSDGEHLGPVEHYVPGWKGLTVMSANFCDHDATNRDEVCWNSLCLRRECVPF
jgi:hypothetical protein